MLVWQEGGKEGSGGSGPAKRGVGKKRGDKQGWDRQERRGCIRDGLLGSVY